MGTVPLCDDSEHVPSAEGGEGAVALQLGVDTLYDRPRDDDAGESVPPLPDIEGGQFPLVDDGGAVHAPQEDAG